MTKKYKVTYKTFLNTRIRKVTLHGVMTHPLYVLVTFDRTPIYFKSAMFELLSKPRFGLTIAGKQGGPTIDQITKAESEHIDFVIDKTIETFSLEYFQQKYKFYCRDLLELMSRNFSEYLYTFFQDKGAPALASILRTGLEQTSPSGLWDDVKLLCKKEVYRELVDNSLHYGAPYIPIYEFIRSTKKWPMLSLTVKEWEEIRTKQTFSDFIARYYPGLDSETATGIIDHWATR